MKRWFSFVSEHRWILSVCALLTFLSGCGQTFFIGLFSSDIRAQFSLSSSEYGLIYSTVTLLSSFVILWAGQQIDRVSVNVYAMVVCCGLIVACLAMFGVSSVWSLALVLFLLRFFGQGLMSHTAITVTTKCLYQDKGKALGLVSFGYRVSEILFPVIVTVCFDFGVSWQLMWLCLGGFVLVSSFVVIDMFQKVTKKYQKDLYWEKEGGAASSECLKQKQWTLSEVLKDWRFYLLILTIISPAFVNTAIFFHQDVIIQLKGLEKHVFGYTFPLYAISTMITSFIGGVVIDKIGSIKMVAVYLLPLALGIMVLSLVSGEWSVCIFMILTGVTSSLSTILSGALWADIYGTRHLGSIRTQVMFWGVFASALSPFGIGFLIDNGVDLLAVLTTLTCYIVITSLMSCFALKLTKA